MFYNAMLSRGKPKDGMSLGPARSGSGDNKKEIRPARTKARGYHFVCAERNLNDSFFISGLRSKYSGFILHYSFKIRLMLRICLSHFPPRGRRGGDCEAVEGVGGVLGLEKVNDNLKS